MIGSSGETLMLIGGCIMAASLVGGIISGIFLRISGKRLEKQLEAEYGPKRRS